MIFNLDNYRREAEIPIQRGISATFQRPFVSLPLSRNLRCASTSLRLSVSSSLSLSVSLPLRPGVITPSHPHHPETQ